jgi:phosphoribosylformylglycinamidine cyclo-ligase
MAEHGEGHTYAAAGVDIEAGERFAERIARSMRRTHSPRVMGPEGAFTGCFRLDYNERLFRRNYRDPVLVSCTDGVGSKILLSAAMNRLEALGQDLVAMSVNDLLVQGAEPLFFLDYIAAHKLEPQRLERLVSGISDACVASGCALLGGETAEVPDLYEAGAFDLAGFAVGVRELHQLIDGSRLAPGDVLLGLASNGVHANGFTLVRRVLESAGLDVHAVHPEVDPDHRLGEVLAAPTRVYAHGVVRALRRYRRKRPISAMAHITGGGLPGNVPRVLHSKVDARIDMNAWPRPPIFSFLQARGGIDEGEMRRVFNLGIGYVLAVRPHFAKAVTRRLRRAGETVHEIGVIEQGAGQVRFTEGNGG